MQKRASAQAAEVARAAEASQVAQLTPERLQSIDHVLSAQENWKDFMATSTPEQIKNFNDDMERRLMDYDLPDHPGLRQNFLTYVKQLGCEDGKPTTEQERVAKIQLAQQGNVLFGSVLGRPGAKTRAGDEF